MMDEQKYTEFYSCGNIKLMYLKYEGRYSFLERENTGEKAWRYNEVIVSSDALEEAMDMPSSYETTPDSKIRLLFGNMEGMTHFVNFCDEYGLDTKSLSWEEGQ